MNLKPIFVLFCIFCFVIYATAQRFVSKGKDTIDNSLGKNWSVSLGYSSIPTRLGETSILADVPEHPLLNESLPAVNLSGGFHLASLFHFRENWYWGLSYSNNSVRNSSKRGKDFVSSFGLNFGYQHPLKYNTKDFFAAFELGIASYNVGRGLVGFQEYNTVRLYRQSASLAPAIRFDVNLYKEQVYLFIQAKYFLNFSKRVRIELDKDSVEERDEIDSFRIRLDAPGVEVNENAHLNFKNPYEFVIGIRYNFDF